MKKRITFLLLLTGFISFYAQKNIGNLSFEKVENKLPTDWKIFGEGQATISVDNTEKQSGNSSAIIESPDTTGFKALAFTLPSNYEGEKITLTGYIKTENITEGFAGLWMRIDPEIAFNNMQEKKLQGTNPWKKYEITLNLDPAKTQKIVIGALLTGKGKMWVDNLQVLIDGTPFEKAKIYEKVFTKADLDKEFDNDSKIKNLSTSKENINNLKTIGLIWGYLKYFHPNVHSGDYNWDYELFRNLPKINNASVSERDKILISWIKSLGTFKTTTLKPSNDVKIESDLKWIAESCFSKELTDLLLKIKTADRKASNYYIEFAPNVNNPIFKNELLYEKMNYNDEGYRVLGLYRYWNMIQYFFPYKNLIEEDWKNVLVEFIPKMIDSNSEEKYSLTTLELIARIHDTHANIWSQNKIMDSLDGKRYSNIKLNFVEEKAVVVDFYDETLAAETNLQIGDIITEIDGQSVDEKVKSSLKYFPASNYPTQLRDIAKKLRRSNAETIAIRYFRNGKMYSTTVKTYERNQINSRDIHEGHYLKMLTPEIAYFYMGTIDSKDFEETFKKINTTKGLVIDFRSYPSDFVVFKLAKYLNSESKPFVKFTITDNHLPGQFSFRMKEKVEGSKNYYKGKVAVLINETTQSSAEYHTMALQTANNAKVFGSTTAGADGNVSKIILPGNIETMISGIGVYYPDGRETQRIGIVPDVEVKPTIEGIKAKKDEVLDKAIEWINQ